MDAERFARVKRILLGARQRNGAEREAYLTSECAGDATLRAEVESLLDHEASDPSLLQTAGALVRGELESDFEIPDRIGPYEVVEELGRGGMGIVVRARQSEPIRREVAIKLIGVHLLSAGLRQRFETERQTLASLDHPNISHVVDAGTDPSGRPYLVMELVEGQPITRFCDERRLSIRDRLELFLQVCDAVQHAHRRGVLHRDIKSSNVLVTTQSEAPRVKMIDFGIAKAIGEGELQDGLTHAGQLVGTPDCMSPEQAGVIDAPVDTRSDVYALGILLFELLTGARPYHFPTGQPREFLRLLDSAGPPTPSSVARGKTTTIGAESRHDAAQLASQRRTSVQELARHLRGDLDAIVLHAIQSQPDDRYESVERLTDDIRRHLDGLPVEAREGGWRYRASKFAARHWLAVSAGALTLVGIVIFVVALAVQRDRAVQAEQTARFEAEASRRVADFMVQLFEVADPSEARGNSVTAREILDEGVERIEGELSEQPALRSRLLDAMGRVYQSLGLFREAEPLLGEALRLRSSIADADGGSLAESMINYGFVLMDLGYYDRAESLYSEALEIRRQTLGERDPDTLSALAGLGNLYIQIGDVDAAEPILEEVLRLELEILGDSHPYVALDYNDLASIRNQRGDYRGAIDYYRRALEINLRANGLDHPETATNLANLGVTFGRVAEYDSAVVYDRRAMEIRERILGPDHAFTGISANNLAGHLQALGRREEALKLFERAIEIKTETQGERHRSTGHAYLGLGRLLTEMGEDRRAEDALSRALDIHRESVGEQHPGTAECLIALGRLYLKHGDSERAKASAAEALRIRRENNTGNADKLAESERLLGEALAANGELAAAVDHLRSAERILADRYGEDSERARALRRRLAELDGP